MSTTAQTQWTLDTAHSEIGFKVRHLVITNVSGKFDSFEGSVTSSSEDFADAQINFSADINSINTGNEQRDGHLKSDDFFNAEQFPKLTFTSTSFKKVSGEQYKLEGHMTIRDITKPVTLDVEFGGTIVDPWGNLKAGFEINGKINRKDFNLKWDALTETGGAVVSDEVKLHIHIELQKTA